MKENQNYYDMLTFSLNLKLDNFTLLLRGARSFWAIGRLLIICCCFVASSSSLFKHALKVNPSESYYRITFQVFAHAARTNLSVEVRSSRRWFSKLSPLYAWLFVHSRNWEYWTRLQKWTRAECRNDIVLRLVDTLGLLTNCLKRLLLYNRNETKPPCR